MRCFLKPTAWVGLLAVLTLGSAADAADRSEKYEIRAAAVTPDILRIPEGSGGVDANIQARVKITGTYTGTVRACEAAVDFGDGSPVEKVMIGGAGGTSNITDIPHTFRKTGRFVVTIASSRSYTSCDGRATAEVAVLGATEQASRSASGRRASTRGERNRHIFRRWTFCG